MVQEIGHLLRHHEAALALLALVICAGSLLSAVQTYRVSLAAGERGAWLMLAGGSLATGVWGSVFVALLANKAFPASGFAVGPTLLAIMVVGLASMTGLAVAARASRGFTFAVAGGVVIGLGIVGVNYIGLWAWQVQGSLSLSWPLVIVSIVVSVGFSVAALTAFRAWSDLRGYWLASLALMIAVISTHAICLAALTIGPAPAAPMQAMLFDRVWIVGTVVTLSAICFVCGMAAATTQHLRRRIDTQLLNLQAEVDERRRAQAKLEGSEARLLAHQSAIAELMTNDSIRSGSLEQATRHLLVVLARGLGIERAGLLLLNRDQTLVERKEIFDVLEGNFIVPDRYGSKEHLEILMRSSSNDIVTIDDTSTSAGLEELREMFFDHHGIKSVLHAPIKSHGDLVGFMTCTNLTGAHAWTTEHRVFALSVANIAALVIERHERMALEETARASAGRLALQQELLNSLIVSERLRKGEITELFEEVAELLCRNMNVDRVAIRFFAEAGIGQIHTEVFLNDDGQVVSIARDPKRHYPRVLSRAMSAGPIVVEDCAADPLTSSMYETRLKPRRTRAMLHAPIRSESTLVGVVACSMFDAPHKWNIEDILLATGVANVFALASERRLRLDTEESLRRANKTAEEASRAKSLFLANMSHEIRTPMNGVLGMADLLSRSGLNERQQRIASTIIDSGQSLLAIINDILDISRIEGGKLELEAVDFDLSQCVEDAVEMLADQAGKKQLDLNLFIDEAVSGGVTGDPVRLRQVLVNLIGNAIKFTAQGEVSVLVLPDGDENGSSVRFVVRDTGIGILPDLQAKLFQPFTQADTSITRRFGGTGLGLSISRHLVEMMGGRIGIESVPGQGALIWFVLPLEVRSSASVNRPDRQRLSGRHVLVVDDRATNREIVSAYMAASGALVVAVEGAAPALQQLKAAREEGRPFDLVIMDFIMPDCDGLELARCIKSTPALASTKMILLSSITWTEDKGDAKAAGIEKVLHKPIRRDELVAGAAACLGGSVGTTEASNDTDSGFQPLGLRVLVAEDNPVNQVVAEEYLSSLGCTATVVENGAQALSECARASFDVVLMDCQMPVMDGYSATRQIRAREAAANCGRMPIIAVTANAYDADRLMCFEAGMDRYLSKPYSEAQLFEVLRASMARERASASTAEAAGQNLEGSVISGAVSSAASEDAESRVGQAIPMVRPLLGEKLVRAYMQHMPQALRSLRTAVDACDSAAISIVAHSLKSSSLNVGLEDTAALAAQLEHAGNAADIETCRELAARISSVFDSLTKAQATERLSQSA